MKPEGREIKRTGYMYGTRMYRVRNWFILGAFGLVFLSAAVTTKILYNPDTKDIRGIHKLEEYRQERDKKHMQRMLEIQERRYAQSVKMGELVGQKDQTSKGI